MPKTLVLIDGTNYAFRAFYAVPPLTNSKGFPTNALHGFANMLVHYHRNEKPDYLAVAFDASSKTFRKDQYTEYKAQRKECPPDLVQQMPWFRKLTEAFSIPFLELEGYEADDIVATIVARTRGEDLRVRIISMDKDLMQLVDERVTLIDTLRNKVYDAPAVEEKWGVPPGKLRDLLALQGDSSDNVPGVPSIGPKKARDLLLEFDSVEGLLSRLPEVKNAKLREVLEKHQADARLSLELVTLHYDVPMEIPLESLSRRLPDPLLCNQVFRELEFQRLLKEYGKLPQEDSGGATPVVAEEKRQSWKAVDSSEGLESALEWLDAAPEWVLELVCEGNGQKAALVALALFDPASRQGISLPPALLTSEAGSAVRLRHLLADAGKRKVGHDFKAAQVRLARVGVRLAGFVGDTSLASYLLNPSRVSHELPELARVMLGLELDPAGKLPGEVEAEAIAALHEKMLPEILAAELGELYHGLEIPLSALLGQLESTGIEVDTARLRSLSGEFESRIQAMEQRIFLLAGEKFNPNSPKQLQTILFEKLKLPITKKTKTGPSTDQSVLEELADKHDLPAEILAYRSLVKLKGTYIDTLPSQVDPSTSRIHTTFNQTVAATGRLSSSDPNLQNIPVRGEEGRKIREAFVARTGCVLLSADYSQIELRLLAHLCGDATLIHAFTHGLDIHAATAADMFGVSLDRVTGEMRRSAKAINFGILYGMGAFRLARELKISRKQAESWIEQYFARYSSVKAFLEATLESARSRGFVTTLANRRRYIPELSASNFNVRQGAERIAVNTPIQGSAADIIKLAMLEVEKALKAGGFETRMLLQVHDELVFEVPEGEVDSVGPVIRRAMESVMNLKVPLTVELGVARDWAHAH